MERVTEPELMNESSQVVAYSQADFEKSDARLIRSLEEFLSIHNLIHSSPKLILDLGCGPGNISEKLSRRFPKSIVIGIDGSKRMIEIAKKRKAKEPLLDNNLSYLCSEISLLLENELIPYKSVDLIVSNSCLHHFHSPNIFWSVIKLLLRKGGVTFHRDLMRPESDDIARELMEKYLPDSPLVLKRDFFASLKAAFSVEEIRSQLDSSGFHKLKVYEVDDKYIEFSALSLG